MFLEALAMNRKTLRHDIQILKDEKKDKDKNKKWLKRIEAVSGEGSIPRVRDIGPFVDKDLKRFVRDSQKSLIRYTKLALKLNAFNKISKKIEKGDTLVSIIKTVLKSKKFFNYWRVKETDQDAETFYRIMNNKDYFNLTDPVAAYIGLHPNLSDVRKPDGTSYSVGERIKLCIHGAEKEGLVKRIGCLLGTVECYLNYGDELELFNKSDDEPEEEDVQHNTSENEVQTAFNALLSSSASADPDTFNANLDAFYNAIKNSKDTTPAAPNSAPATSTENNPSMTADQDVDDSDTNSKPAKKGKKS